jgi:CCR4-NOT transcription complex subunit 6
MWGFKPERDAFEEPIAEWSEVANGRHYCPTTQDIDRPLRLEIIPVLKDGRDSNKGGMSITTGTVIPTPKEARTRRMISNGGTFNAEWLSQQFKVMNWNVLADLYATEAVYPYCEKWALSWSWRKHLILKELKSMAADIITLQEVQKDAYDDWFRPQLADCGYEGVFQQKKREAIFHRGKYTAEGCATFYKTTRFNRVDKHIVDYDKLSANELNNLVDRQAAEKGLQRLSKGNIALAVMLEDLHIKTSSSQQATGPTGGHLICVINTHILADPGFTDVKLWQAHLLLRTLEQLPDRNMPLLVCGDFNSTPDSAVYEYCLQGSVPQDHEDFRSDPCGILKQLNCGHSLRIATAYETCNGREAQYTNYTEDFKGTLDYIWFTLDTLSVLAISQVDDESQLMQETALPSSTRPSDHVSLVATFMFKDLPTEAQPSVNQNGGNRGSMSGGGYHTGNSLVNSGSGATGDNLFVPGASAYPAQYGSRSYGGGLWS